MHTKTYLDTDAPRGGGVLGLEKGKTVDRMLRSCGCREQTMLKMGGCPVITNDYRELLSMWVTLQKCPPPPKEM